jgi:hypothetical protein
MLETLYDDAPQTMFYLINQKAAHRFLGARFRADDGTAANFTGPWFDIFDVAASARAQISTPQRLKRYRFDSTTQLLTKVEYLVTANDRVTTEYSGWTISQGQATPRHIIRTNGGTTVFQVDIATALVGPAASDGIFPGH